MMKKLLCLLLVFSLLTVPALAIKGQVADPEELPYIPTEGGPSAWAVSEIEAAAAAGLIPQLTGSPAYQDSITREQFAELAATLVLVCTGEDSTPDSPAGFTDCTNPLVGFAAECGIVNGVGDGKFNPAATTNREQIAAMVARSITYLETECSADVTTEAGSIEKFSDKAAVSAWAAESMGILAANGIFKGTSDTTLSPKNPCTVEQSILLCYRVYRLFAEAV